MKNNPKDRESKFQYGVQLEGPKVKIFKCFRAHLSNSSPELLLTHQSDNFLTYLTNNLPNTPAYEAEALRIQPDGSWKRKLHHFRKLWLSFMGHVCTRYLSSTVKCHTKLSNPYKTPVEQMRKLRFKNKPSKLPQVNKSVNGKGKILAFATDNSILLHRSSKDGP